MRDELDAQVAALAAATRCPSDKIALEALAGADYEADVLSKRCSVIDLLDGRLARLGGQESPFGREFDSLADVISFGMAPSMLMAKAVVPLAPLHNPANLTAIRALERLVPDLPQYASFDTAFHATNPEVALRYALPPEAEALGLRRYGFHGISYASLVLTVQEIGGNQLPQRLLAFHLGNGASACAILDGQSVASTMGYSPLDGLTMGTRPGNLDPAVVLDLLKLHYDPTYAQSISRNFSQYGQALPCVLRDRSPAALNEAAASLIAGEAAAPASQAG